MKRVFKWLGALVLLVVAGLLAPVGYVELACRPTGDLRAYDPILPPAHRRAEGRTLLTYPEWHIVHAYEDYARVIRDGDPHDYRYAASIGGFWSSLCSLSRGSGPYGGFPGEFKSTAYTIGVSFTAELAAKALYEETLGRVATWIRGAEHAPLDDLSAQQAAHYSRFLQQVPWYRWEFASDAAALTAAATGAFRDRERRWALGLEYGAKAQYAKVIAAAVAEMEPDALRLRMIVTGLGDAQLADYTDVTVIARHAQGTEVETPRYRALTHLLAQMALDGGDFVEIAGNDDILFTVTSQTPKLDGALYSVARQGFDDTRHLVMVPVSTLADRLRGLSAQGLHLEHVHDY